METIKINNPLYIAQVAPLIHAFFKKVEKNPSVKGISYESLTSYFQSIAQYGGELAEFHVVMDDDKPIAFAMWRVLGPPHFGVSFCEYIYNSTNANKPMEALCEKFVEFGENHNTPYYGFMTVNDAVSRRLTTIGKQYGVTMEDMGTTNLIGRKT
jgi:hypothetical protein